MAQLYSCDNTGCDKTTPVDTQTFASAKWLRVERLMGDSAQRGGYLGSADYYVFCGPACLSQNLSRWV